MNTNQIDLVVFDMAGTTVEDGGQVPAAFSAVLERRGIAISAQEIHALRGMSKRAALAEILQKTHGRMATVDEVGKLFADFQQELAARYDGTVKEVSGASATFAWLREQGIKVALNTGFERETVNLLLDALGWTVGVVDAVICGDEVAAGRPAPYLVFHAMEATGVNDVRQVMVVGDTVLDLQAGYNAGAGFVIGVLSGAHQREQLEKQPHTHLLESVAALPERLQTDLKS